jgi:hypothetical protein
MQFTDPTSNKIVSWIVRVVSFVIGAPMLLNSLFVLWIAGCHDSGGFCAGGIVPGYYAVGIGEFLLASVLLAWAFTAKWQKVKITLAAAAMMVLILIFSIESLN